MKLCILMIPLILINCSQTAGQKRGRDCTIEDAGEAGLRISCDDGTENLIPKQVSCRAEALDPANPGNGGVVVSCPPDFEPIVIPNGPEGGQGASCELRNVVARNEKVLVCNGEIVIVGK